MNRALPVAVRGVLLTLALLAAVLGLAGGAAAAPEPDGQITDVHTRAGTVQFIFSAGNLPEDSTLDPKSLVVTADGETLDATASPADASRQPQQTVVREVVVVIDVSGSMEGDGIQAAQSAALAYARSLPPDVRVGLVTFANSTRIALKPTKDRAAFETAVGGLQAGGETALYDGVVVAARLMENLPATADRRMLILSDGDDTVSRRSIADVTAAVVRAKIAADVVAFRLPGDQESLNQIASASQGKVLPAASAEDLAAVFSAAAQAFRQQVLVTVTVPESLSNETTELTVTLNGGAASVSATSEVTMPFAVAGSGSDPGLEVSEPVSDSSSKLWIVVALTFIAFLAVASAFLFIPMLGRQRKDKDARLAEMMRYRVVGVTGLGGGAPQFTGTAVDPSRPERSAITTRALSIADRNIRARGQRAGLVSELERAGMRMRPEEWAVIQFLAVVGGAGAVGVFTRSFIWALVGAIAGWVLVRLFIRRKINKRAAEFERQLPDTLQLLAGSLRTGFSLNQAFTSVVREGTEPTASEFARALTEVRLGAELEDALDDVAVRMKCEDLAWVVIAVRISREVGGNLAEVLSTTVTTMRQRAELRGQVRVLSAEGRISARLLTAMPIGILAYLAVVNPDYVDPLFHTGVGIILLCVGALLLILGSYWLSRLVKIKV